MDAATLGTLLVGVGAVAGALVTWLGKRSETAITGYSSLTNDLQEERDALKGERDDLRTQLAARDARISELGAYRAADQAEIARLRGIIVRLGGQP